MTAPPTPGRKIEPWRIAIAVLGLVITLLPFGLGLFMVADDLKSSTDKFDGLGVALGSGMAGLAFVPLLLWVLWLFRPQRHGLFWCAAALTLMLVLGFLSLGIF